MDALVFVEQFMFDHGLFVHLIRIALIEEIALPGMMAHKRLVTKQREKAKKLAGKIVESDQEFEENMTFIEMQANTQLRKQFNRSYRLNWKGKLNCKHQIFYPQIRLKL
jgi:hypothetical protein